MVINILIFFLIGLQDKKQSTVTIEIDQVKTGWYYIVPIEKRVNVGKLARSDSNGVIYMNSERYKDIRKIVVLRDGVDVSDEIKFLSKSAHNEYRDNKHDKYEFMKFFIPQTNLVQEWDNPEVHYKYSIEEKEYRDKLIQEGKIKFN